MVEFRDSQHAPRVVTRAAGDGGVPEAIEGTAALYDVETVIAGLFRERIARGAFTDTLRNGDDTLARFAHSDERVLGRRSAGTLTLREDARGLHYRIQVNADDPLAVSAAAQVGRRDVIGSSFAFDIADARDEEWFAPRDAEDLPLRVIYRMTLVDVAPVARPAYEGTTVAASRNNGEVERQQMRAELERAKRWGGCRIET